MQQLWIINGELVYSGPYLPLPGGNLPSGGLNYGFYDEKTGDVWGKRLNAAGGGTWIFTPGYGKYPDIRLPYEITADWIPNSYYEWLINYFIRIQGLTRDQEDAILSNYPNLQPGTPT